MDLELLDDAMVDRVLVVVAHPDDVDYGAAGSVARWTAAGAEVVYCVVTDGESGGTDPKLTRAELGPRRRAEQVAAAAAVGVHDVRFLGYPDGELTASLELRRDITRVIRQVRPHRVVTHSPEIVWRLPAANHPDHRATGDATLSAVYPDAGNRLAHPTLLTEEGLAAWSARELWMITAPRANHHVDVTETFPAKVAALRAHASQLAGSYDIEARLRPRLAAVAEHGGLPDGRLAERFFVTVFG